MKIEFFIITVEFLDPENIPMTNIFKKFGREGKNPGGMVSTPLGRPKVDFYLGHLRVKRVYRLFIPRSLYFLYLKIGESVRASLNRTATASQWCYYYTALLSKKTV